MIGFLMLLRLHISALADVMVVAGWKRWLSSVLRMTRSQHQTFQMLPIPKVGPGQRVQCMAACQHTLGQHVSVLMRAG